MAGARDHDRAERLAAALRANLRRRKTQARGPAPPLLPTASDGQGSSGDESEEGGGPPAGQ